MDQRLLKTLLDMDERHWWARGRRQIIRAELDQLALPSDTQILDAGCGSGRTLEELADYGTVAGLELSPDAAEVARGRGLGEVQIGRVEELPWPSDNFDLITCLDVIEHVPDDRGALRELRRVSKPGGWLLVTVPAYQRLWSYHDVANEHYRRYERATLRAAVTDAGWRLERMTSLTHCSSHRRRPYASRSAGCAATAQVRRRSVSIFNWAPPGSMASSSGR